METLFAYLVKRSQRFRNAHYPKIPIKPFIPEKLVPAVKTLDTGSTASAWRGLELVIPDILSRFGVATGSCIEFGVEFGYSTVAFSNYFDKVVGIDLFVGDVNTVHHGDHFRETQARLSAFPNIELHKTSYQDWIASDDSYYDLAHVDIVHTYRDTFQCGLWAAQHSTCTLFHDTESFIDVRNAVIDVARSAGKEVFNYPHHYGLGIVVG
jgi:hypothetical protein